MYVAEISHKSLRKRLGILQSTFASTALLTNYTTGYWLEWRHVLLVNAVFPLLSMAAMAGLPETPYWLIEQGRMDEAK